MLLCLHKASWPERYEFARFAFHFWICFHAMIQENLSERPDTFFVFVCFCFLDMFIFQRRLYGPFLEAFGHKGSNCFSRGVQNSISKETYSHL